VKVACGGVGRGHGTAATKKMRKWKKVCKKKEKYYLFINGVEVGDYADRWDPSGSETESSGKK
jgi:hypothetical protein